MADNKFDFNKLKESAGDLMGGLRSMINPAAAVPAVNPDDALGMKIAQLATFIKQLTEAQQEQVKNFNKLNEMLNAAFQDIEALRNQIKTEKAAVPPLAAAPTATPPISSTEEKKDNELA